MSRGARFLAEYLPTVGLGAWVPVAAEIVHFTGYEVPFSQIKVSDPRDIKMGHLIGTADMVAQMADRALEVYGELSGVGARVAESPRASFAVAEGRE